MARSGWRAPESHVSVVDVNRLVTLAVLLGCSAQVHADGAFCEVTPCVPGPVIRRVLTKDERVGALTCKKGQELGVDSKRRVVFCTTAKPADVAGLAIAAASYTLFHPNGRIYQTHLRATVERTLADQSKVTCGADLIALTDDGKLSYCKLAKPRTSTPRARVGEGISFHPSGRIAGATLDEPYTAAGLALPAGASAVWDGNGVLVGGYVRDPIQAGTLSIRSDFALHPNGKLRIVELAVAAKVQGNDFPEDAKLAFHVDGTLERAEYVSAHGFMIHGEQWRDTVHATYDAAGKLATSTTDHWQEESSNAHHK